MLEINTRTNQYADYFLPSTIKTLEQSTTYGKRSFRFAESEANSFETSTNSNKGCQ
jgi:hypothetical protein